jgi:hypothetical protein
MKTLVLVLLLSSAVQAASPVALVRSKYHGPRLGVVGGDPVSAPKAPAGCYRLPDGRMVCPQRGVQRSVQRGLFQRVFGR